MPAHQQVNSLLQQQHTRFVHVLVDSMGREGGPRLCEPGGSRQATTMDRRAITLTPSLWHLSRYRRRPIRYPLVFVPRRGRGLVTPDISLTFAANMRLCYTGFSSLKRARRRCQRPRLVGNLVRVGHHE